ncbi:hypothetical protein [Bradyrhizobium sp. CCBAU 51765]|uniref:hypothetical protein n=1 Tax=Bradyrhizobium sp. CCBAU 51765 TaxID=1325102 RepID=UPI0018889E2E|nr:hypothetical protein [Bradyrhizobium sp. CCBAU 51765]QOZ11915.1 hypothetical protein XH96_34140 [Bradyrhizobium sp. CCBAU 51765]
MADDRDVFQKSFKGLLEQALRADDWAEDQAQTLPAQILQNSIPEVADFMLKQPKKNAPRMLREPKESDAASEREPSKR